MYGRPDENWIVACGCLSGYNKLEINRYWDWHQDLEAYGKYLRLSPVSANLNVSKRKQSPFKLISCCCKQVAIKVESLSGFTNSLLRPYVFPQVVCLLHCYLVSLHFTLLDQIWSSVHWNCRLSWMIQLRSIWFHFKNLNHYLLT